MNKVTKFLVGAFAVAALMVAGTASAASISNPLFSNGQTSIDAAGGSTVSGTYTLTVGPGEVVEFLRYQSDPSQPFADVDSNKTLGYQEQVWNNVPFSVKVPPNTGTYTPTVQGAGIFGGARSINGGDNVVLGATNLGTVRVTANGSTSGSTDTTATTTQQVPSWVPDFLATLWLMINKPAATTTPTTPVPTPTVNTVCTQLDSKLIGTQDDVYSDANVALQGFLLSEHASIPALKAGASFGFKGAQTRTAISWLKNANSCK